MNYLSGLLKGEAARVIHGLPLSESNYQRAVNLLKERFGQEQVLIPYWYLISRVFNFAFFAIVKKSRN